MMNFHSTQKFKMFQSALIKPCAENYDNPAHRKTLESPRTKTVLKLLLNKQLTPNFPSVFAMKNLIMQINLCGKKFPLDYEICFLIEFHMIIKSATVITTRRCQQQTEKKVFWWRIAELKAFSGGDLNNFWCDFRRW